MMENMSTANHLWFCHSLRNLVSVPLLQQTNIFLREQSKALTVFGTLFSDLGQVRKPSNVYSLKAGLSLFVLILMPYILSFVNKLKS
jgi:hypothetical protein